MHFEHAAMNVPDPQAMAQWYVRNCGLRTVVATTTPPYVHFLADVTGRVIFELYANPKAVIPDYASQHPLVLHLAFAVEDVDKTKAHLLEAGATEFSDETQANGSRLVMLRDPWGVPLQLVKRTVPLGA
ncbi:MAG: VOC family protein [Anaerolineae bacterium]|nr:VOC family protein [Anaerolineae bacterium]